MKLVLVLSVIACGYAAKLDRTYLPPSSAASAGGSPGAITAPESGFGRGSASAGFGQDLPNGPASKPFGQPASNVPTGQGSNQASSFPGADSRPSFGKPFNQGSNQAGFPGNSFKDNEIGSDDSRPSGQFNSQGSRTPFGQTPDFAQEQRAERPQADADRNAEILKYVNENNGDSYEYSYETSNGISAGESGVATNGVMAQGGFSYTGDDGKAYFITYTADENGFQPEGEHLPTPHPIPEEILKSIEENAKAAASGTQEGAYRPEEYESESSPSQQYGNGLQRPQQGPSVTSQRKPDQGNNNYPETSRQQKPSQQPSGNTFDVPRGQRPGGDGYNYNRPTQGQVQSQQPSQAFGNVGNNDISGPASRPNQFNQPQRNQPAEQPKGFTTQYQNQGRSSNQYQQQNGQPQGDNDYNYNKPQATSPESQSSNQENQPQKPFSGFGSNNQELSATPQGPRPSNVNQQKPQFSQNTFGSQPQKYSPSQTGQTQRDNGYTYNQPQGSQNSGPQGLQDSRFPDNQQSNKNVFGQQSSQPSRDFNQAQRPISGSDNAFGRPQVPSNQYTQGPRGQEQIGNGYNYNQPKKSSGTQPGQSQLFSQGVTSQSGPQDGPNQFNQRERPSQGPFSGNQQGPSNKFPSGQRGQDQDENGYYYNRPQNTQSQGPFGQQTQSGAPNQYVFSPRPTAFDSNNQGARPGPMKPSFGQTRPESDTGRQQYSPENRPSFGSTQPDSRPQGSDASRPTEKFQPSLAPASQFGLQQLGQKMPTGQDAPNQSQSRPSSFGPSSGNAFTQGQNKPSSFGQSPPNAEQTLAQGYQYGPGQSNQPQRPGSNGQGYGTPGATKGPGSEFGGPRQPPSFSPEEGYKY